jgi:hypothetical protein
VICVFCEFEYEGDDRYGCPNCNGEGLDTKTANDPKKSKPKPTALAVNRAIHAQGSTR